MNLMTYNEYESEFRRYMKKFCYGNDAEIESYIKLMIEHNCVMNRYISDRELSEMFGKNRMNPSALASNASDLSPEDWPMEEVKDKSVFEGAMNFKSVHKK